MPNLIRRGDPSLGEDLVVIRCAAAVQTLSSVPPTLAPHRTLEHRLNSAAPGPTADSGAPTATAVAPVLVHREEPSV